MKGYRIVEDHNGVYKTLFHGVGGSRTIPMDKWLTAKEKMVRDGTGDKWYLSGFHALKTVEEMVDYAKSFRNRRNILKIAEVELKGIRYKEHSKAEVILAKKMKLTKILDIEL